LQVKEIAMRELFVSATAITEQAVIQITNEPLQALPSMLNIARAANRYRAKNRPKEPKAADFILQQEFIPSDFLVKDLILDGARHVIFATKQMLELLSKARKWYIDATFKVVRRPFHQLLSIHAFVKKEGILKQVPLCFVLMSRRQKRDYRAVLKCIKDLLPNPLRVTEVLSDFEAALWRSCRKILGESIVHKGCVFHWAQALWRQIQEVGLARAYRTDNAVHKYCRKLLALPFLPAEHILSVFEELEAEVNVSAPEITRFVSYVRNTWICSTLWPPSSWTCFNESVRTNNDTEGWHGRLNRRAGNGNLGIYRLADLLFQESKIVTVSIKLLSEGKVQRMQRKATNTVNKKLFRYWEEYLTGKRSVQKLLRTCGKL